MPRGRVYLTLSVRDADLLNEVVGEVLAGEHDFPPERLEKIQNRLVELTEAQRPNLAEGMFEGPPDDFVE